jgi:Protein of unknown function (DUF2971)
MFRHEAGDYLFHYTTLATAVEHILPTRKFRMSPFSQMRDPRESHQWAASGATYDPAPMGENELFFGFSERLMEEKATFKVMSLTRDIERPPPNGIFGRGFARPRLWEQYGGNHAGVCLCFDRSALLAELEPQLSRLGAMRHDEVVYEDDQIHVLHFDMREVVDRGIDPVLDQLLDRNTDELFFKKLRDWETEFEYRFIVRTSDHEPVLVNIANALRGVVLGPLVSTQYLPAVRALCDPADVKIARLIWWNGRPIAVPPAREEQGPSVVLDSVQFEAAPDPAKPAARTSG